MNLFQPEVPFPSKVLSITQLNSHIKLLLEKDSVLSGLWVQGEVSNLVVAASGHSYFTLKDKNSTVRATLWGGNRRRIGINFKNGDLVMVFGNISLYPPRGEYQLTVTDLRQAGIGALYEAYEKLKAKLNAEGLFDPARKLKLPLIPKGVGIVTSPKGAVIQDIYRVIRRRFKNTPLFLVPSKVQGEGAAEEIAAGIQRLNADSRVDVIIVARGGGSLEDLWAFNEEVVARAISESPKPVVSAVGHETDTTIADLVADKRAATPSVAGELVVPVKADLIKNTLKYVTRLDSSAKRLLLLNKERLKRAISCRFLNNPSLLIAEKRLKIINLSRELDILFRHYLSKQQHRLDLINAGLSALNPYISLEKGYVMARDDENRVLNSVTKIAVGQSIKLFFADGVAEAVINKIDLEEKNV